MPNNNLILRSVVSPWIIPTPDFTRNSVLSFSDVDNNFIYLKGELINSIETSGNTITLKKINGNDLSFNVGSGGGSGYWTSGSTGFYSIKTINDSGLDATGNYSVASGFNTLSSGNVSFTHSTNSTASSDYTSILGGQNNEITSSSNNSSIVGGENGIISGSAYSFIAGGQNHLIDSTNGYNVIVGGNNHAIHVVGFAGIVAGQNNIISGQTGGPSYEFMGGGNGNIINNSEGSVIVGGYNNEISSNGRADNFITGGNNQIYESGTATIVGGVRNVINNESNGGIIAGGGDGTITTSDSGGIFAGNVNELIDSNGSSIIGGQYNLLSGASQSVILGGQNITGTSDNTVYTTHLEVRGQAYTPIYDNLTGGTTFVPDWDNSNVQILTLSGNTNVSGGTSTMKGGSTYTMIIKQSNGGSHTITWDTSVYKWEAGSAPTLSVADGSVDIITFICDGTSLYGLIAKDFQ